MHSQAARWVAGGVSSRELFTRVLPLAYLVKISRCCGGVQLSLRCHCGVVKLRLVKATWGLGVFTDGYSSIELQTSAHLCAAEVHS